MPLTCVDLSAVPETEQESTLSAIATDLQTTLNLSSGRVVRIALFDLGTSQRLLLVIHHLVVDGVSWRILLEDLQIAYQQLSQGQAIQLPPKTTSFKHWAERLTEYAQSEALQQELDYWLTQSRRQIAPLPVDFPGGDNTVAHSHTISISLSQEETQALLQDVPAAYQTQINDVLLTALVQAVKQWTGESLLLVDLEGHGREEIFEDVDLSRTVGWFTTLFPVLLDIGAASSLADALKTVKEQLRNVPNRGIGYGYCAISVLGIRAWKPKLKSDLTIWGSPTKCFLIHRYLHQPRSLAVRDAVCKEAELICSISMELLQAVSCDWIGRIARRFIVETRLRI
jgi:hypothetical protein